MPELSQPVYAAVLFADRVSSVGMLDRVKTVRRISGAGFEAAVGEVGGQVVVVAAPTETLPAFDRILAAMRDAYRPRLAIGCGFSGATPGGAPVGAVVLASRVLGAGGESLKLSHAIDRARAAGMPDAREGAIADAAVGQQSGALATNDWSYAFAAACANHGQPAAVVSVVSDDPSESVGEEVANVHRQPTAAGKAGALLRAAWRRPRSLVELAKGRTDVWRHQETLADAVEAILRVADTGA